MNQIKEDHLKAMKDLNATIKLTFKSPKVSTNIDKEFCPMGIQDTDFFEQEILRQFFINMNRVVKFDFAAYPEDRVYDNDKKFTPLHYHAVAKTENDKKFIKIAAKKYAAVVRSKCQQHFSNFIMPIDPLYIEVLNRNEPTSYEEYCLKHYRPEVRLLTNDDFKTKPCVPTSMCSLSREVSPRVKLTQQTRFLDEDTLNYLRQIAAE